MEPAIGSRWFYGTDPNPTPILTVTAVSMLICRDPAIDGEMLVIYTSDASGCEGRTFATYMSDWHLFRPVEVL